INRLRKRAQTDLAELRGHYNRHDGLVIVLAMIIIMVVGRIHAQMVQPPTVTFARRGLTFEHSQAWLAPEPIAFAPSRLLRDFGVPTRSKDPEKDAYHVEFTSTIDPAARIEVLIDKKPAWSNIVSGLDLDRRTRWGELYKMDASSVVDVEGHDWLRTEYTFAHAPQKGDTPRVDRAVEYATKDKDQLYVLTLFGSQREVARVEEVVAPSLRVATNVGLQIEAQTMRLSRQNYPKPVGRAFESTVMIVVADLVDGRLRVKGGGSGIIVGGDGSILTAYHVIHDKDGRLHDVFVIGRFAEADKPPTLMCAGRPSRSKLQRDVDLALVKCDMDLDGRAWLPTSAAGVWQTLPEARKADINMGQRLWVLGYPDAGGGGLTLSQGEVEGFTGVDGAQGRDYIKTDASIRSGNSGGPVVDDKGQLVGIAAAFRTRVNVSSVTETTQVGLVRPLSTASDLLAIAAAGWTPREGHTDVELAPVAVEAPAEGVHLSTKIVDAANEAPIAEALVMVLRKGVSSEDVDVNRLDDQVLSWGRSNSLGEVLLKQPVPVPGTYSVLVIARGYEPLIGKEALTLDADTAASFDPWGKIWLRSR
ncbi:MAG: serine protease, partial [Proteobacteria bacterium]|nr:serine protease [Pseudomonadota bacterium]